MGRLVYALVILFVSACVFFASTQAASKDLPLPTANVKPVTAGALVIPMDSRQYISGSFNVKAYGLAVHLLYNEIPLFWSIRAGKAKDAKDFSANAQQVYPTTGTAGNQDYSAGPLIILKVNADKALGLIKTWNSGNHGVVVHKILVNTEADIRHEIFTKPKILISNLSGYSHTQINILTAAGLKQNTHYIVADGPQAIIALQESSCYTFFSEPHYIWNDNAPSYYASVGKFVSSGGNFLAECAGLWSYENYNPSSGRGGFQSIAGLYTYGTGNTVLKYPNPDVPYNQFLGELDGVNSGHTPDYCFYPPSNIGDTQVNEATEKSWLINNAYYTVINDPAKAKCTNGQTRVIASVSKPGQGTGIGGLVFYIGAHDWSPAGTNGNRDAGKRLYLNALLTPAKRFPVCEFDFCPPGQECPHDACHTCLCNNDGVAVVTKIDGCCIGESDCGSCETCENKQCKAECGSSNGACSVCNTATDKCDPVACPCTTDDDCLPCYGCADPGTGTSVCTLITEECCTSNDDCAPCGYCDFAHPINPARQNTKRYTICKATPNCCENDGECGDCQTCDVQNNVCVSDCTPCQTCQTGSQTCQDVDGCCFINTQCDGCQVCDFGTSSCVGCPECTECGKDGCEPVAGCCTLDDECTGACQKCTDNECRTTITGELGSCCTNAKDCTAEGTTCASFGTCATVCKKDSDCDDCQGCVDGVCQDSNCEDRDGGDGGSDAARVTLGLKELL